MTKQAMNPYHWTFRVTTILLVLTVLTMAGCRTAPIRNMGPTSIPTSATKTDVEKAIMGAGAGLGWSMKETFPGLITGTLALRSHLAVVEIAYSSRNFSIRYKSSQNLKYNASDKTIHSNYNGWVRNLHNAILAQVSVL